MTTITYIDHEGTERKVDATNGNTVMETAVDNGVPGIDGDCGGACACATCHVFVDAAYLAKLPPKDDTEEAMLEFSDSVQENSRLACQIVISDELEGLTVTTPEFQG